MKFYGLDVKPGTYDACSKAVHVTEPRHDTIKDVMVSEMCTKEARRESRKRERELRLLLAKTTAKYVATSLVTYIVLGLYAATLFLAHFALYENRVVMLEDEAVLVRTINPMAVASVVGVTLAVVVFFCAWIRENADEAQRYWAWKSLWF